MDDLAAEMAALTEAEVEEHVAGIMFDSLSAPETDCMWCQRAIELGVWRRYGVEDPFAEEKRVTAHIGRKPEGSD